MGSIRNTISRIIPKEGITNSSALPLVIGSGIMMLWKPEKARKSLAGQGFGLVKGYIFILAIFLGALLINAANKLNGLLALVILILGIVFLIKSYLFLKKKISNKIQEWMKKVPILYLRCYAVIQIIIGMAMLAFRKRIYF